MYLPALNDARIVASYTFGQDILTTILTDCKSSGAIQYTHVMLVYRLNPDEPDQPTIIMAVASEINRMAHLGGGSHFLGVFPGNGHTNLGASDEWADLQTFIQKALEVTAGYLNLNAPPVRIDLGSSRFN
jgi:hypothetical protein